MSEEEPGRRAFVWLMFCLVGASVSLGVGIVGVARMLTEDAGQYAPIYAMGTLMVSYIVAGGWIRLMGRWGDGSAE